MKNKLTYILFLLAPLFAYAQALDQIDFYPLKILDTIYSQKQIDEIKKKHFINSGFKAIDFYIDKERIDENLFLCKVERENVFYDYNENIKTGFYWTIIKKEQNFWLMYHYEDYWGMPENALTDNQFYIITNISGNSGHNGSSGGNWTWGNNTAYFLDYKNMSVSEEISTSYEWSKTYIESEEDIEKYKSEHGFSYDYINIFYSKKCSMEYAIQNSTLTISNSFCKNEAYRYIKEIIIEQIEEIDTECPCLSDAVYHYIDEKFIKTE